ncbi:MAG: hypothetical protein AVO34_02070 [Firmicutes bacterium ML8_F2]|nr:MAG: hypothetical protein AVO34_02070 [Firmicutes bacterium ML8_F2]
MFEKSNWILPSIGFLILLTFLGLSWLITKSRAVLLTNLAIALICFFLSFGFNFEYLIIVVVSFLLFVFGSCQAINEKKDRVKIKVKRIFKRGLPMVLTGLCLLIAAAYYFSPLALQGENEIEIPRSWFDKIIVPALNIFGEQTDNSLMMDSQLKSQLENQLKDDLYQTVNQEINRHSQSYRQYFSLGLAIGFFFALRTIGIVFGWLVILLSWLVFRILVFSGAVKIQEKAVLKEVIEL